METKLARISQLSKENPDMVFTSLGHLINKEMLKSCHTQMDGTKAVGIDGITKEEYGRSLEENINALIERLKKKSYKPKPARLVEIPKDNGKMRPLSIYCHEDKLVQEALRRILEAVFEPIFYDEMMGFRPNRGCHKAIRKLNLMLERKPTSYVLDADIKGFFQHLDHEWIIRFIGSRIKDPNIIRLVRRMLKAGIMNNYEFEETEEGSGQGSVCSPVISCIYMHYVLVNKNKEGKFFVGFTPAVSEKAKTAMKQKIRGWKIQLKADLSLKDIGNMINKVVQGWINYYTHYYKSEFYEVLRYINQCLIKWVRRSYKKKNTRSRAEHWLGAVARRDRNLFAHWKFGILPSVGEGAV